MKAPKAEIISIDHEGINITLSGITQHQTFGRYAINDRAGYYISILWNGVTGSIEARVNSVAVTYFYAAFSGQQSL